MVATTIAAVRGERTSQRSILALSHFAGLIAGAAAVMCVVVATSALLASTPTVGIAALVASAVAMGAGAAAAVGRPVPFPSPSWQVPLAWRYLFRPIVYLFWYGVGLGAGFFTRLRSLSLHVCVLVVFVAGSPAIALSTALAYAGARAFPVAILSRHRELAPTNVGRPGQLYARLVRVDGLVLLLAGVAVLGAEVGRW